MRSLRASLAAVAAVVVFGGTLVAAPAAASSAPPDILGAMLYADDFDEVDDWTLISGPASAGGADGGNLVFNTLGESSGRYLRPTDGPTLPDAYELRTRMRIDEMKSDGTVSVLLDMTNKTTLKASGISPQFTAFAAEKRAGIQMAKPIASAISCRGTTPVKAGTWAAVKIQRAAGITALYVNGQLVAADTSPARGGTIGFGAYHAKVGFDAVEVQELTSTPVGHPTAAGCTWQPPTCSTTGSTGPGDGEIAGDAAWTPAAAASTDRPGHEVTAGQGTLSLDGDWAFITDPSEEGEGAGFTDPDTSTWETRPVPGNWDVSDAHGTYTGHAWYARDFEAAPASAAAHERVWLKFGAVYATASIWLNGIYVGCHRGGYTPFEFDVTRLLVDGENTLVVRADNSFQQGAWWSWGGISRSIQLVRTDEVRIDRQQIVAIPDRSDGTARVTSTVFVDNDAAVPHTVEITGAITDAATGAVIADGLSAELTIPARETGSAELSVDLADDEYRLWEIDDPALYRFDVALDVADGHTDSAQSDRFGIREFTIAEGRMILNGEPLKLAGANRVSDDPAHGNTEPVALVRRDLDRMKASGLDLTRIMHYAQSPELLDYADEIGMLLIDEVPVWQQGRDLVKDIPAIKQEFREMVERDFNHPSIFAHSVANEIPADGQAGREYDRIMAEYSKAIDPSRFVTQATNTMNWVTDPTKDGSQYMDFVSINMYGNFEAIVDKVNRFWPSKPVFVSEYSPDGYTFGTDRESLDFATDSGDTARIFAKKPFIFGWSQWTYNDYRSKFDGTGFNLVRGWGNQDVWGRVKTGYAATQEANAPVSLELGSASSDGVMGVGVATITPRPLTTPISPVRTLRDHRLVVRATAADGTGVGGTVVDLADIEPGSASIEIPFSWDASGAASRVTVSLLSATGYEIALDAQDIARPEAPQITDTVVADGAVRVRYTDPAAIGEYTVSATAPGETTPAVQLTTAEPFADLTGLDNGVAYTVRVAAVGTTQTSASADVVLTPVAGHPLPPKVVALTSVDRGLVLGFSDEIRGGAFDVRVVEAASGAEVARYTTTNRPGTRVEGLIPGQAYHVSIRRAGGTADGGWSEPLTATPLGESSKADLDVRGTVAGSHAAGVVVDPTSGTERYRLTVAGAGLNRTVTVERAAVEVLPIDDLAPATDYSVSVTAVGPTGDSVTWSGQIRTQAAAASTAPAAPTDVVRGNRGTDAVLTWTRQDAEGYVVSRTDCGATTTLASITPEATIGHVGLVPGSYTVRALAGGRISGHSDAVEVPGLVLCDAVVTPADTAKRGDGSVPYAEIGSWYGSAVRGPDAHPSRYADPPAGARAVYTAPLTSGPASYRVLAALPKSTESVARARYTITNGAEEKTVDVDQTSTKKRWVDLGTIAVDAGQRVTVTLTGTGTGFLRASAVRFLPALTSADYPTVPQPKIADQVIDPGSPVTGEGTPGQRVTLNNADGASIAETTVNDDGSWSVLPVPALAPGSWLITATAHDDDGWTGSATATVRVADGANAAPARGVLSTNSGVLTGLRDGAHQVTLNMWWGENASSFRLYENGTLIASRALGMATPHAQTASVALTGRPNGTYTYTGVLENSAGVTELVPVTVEVVHANPGIPVLSDDNWDGDGTFALTADMWWGTNATSYRFLEDAVVIAEGSLVAASPAAQRARVELRGRAPGVHTYTVEFTNAAGTTVSAPRTIVVR